MGKAHFRFRFWLAHTHTHTLSHFLRELLALNVTCAVLELVVLWLRFFIAMAVECTDQLKQNSTISKSLVPFANDKHHGWARCQTFGNLLSRQIYRYLVLSTRIRAIILNVYCQVISKPSWANTEQLSHVLVHNLGKLKKSIVPCSCTMFCNVFQNLTKNIVCQRHCKKNETRNNSTWHRTYPWFNTNFEQVFFAFCVQDVGKKEKKDGRCLWFENSKFESKSIGMCLVIGILEFFILPKYL